MKRYVILLLSVCAINFNANADEIGTVSAITEFNSSQYLGKWYEIARIPFYFENQCLAPVTAEYSVDGNDVAVKNSCMTASGKTDTSTGMAYFNESQSIAKLKVTFLPAWLRFTHLGRGDYWVLYTDYNYSLVGSPNHKYLWILSRTETPELTEIKRLLTIAKTQGFDTNQLLFNYPQFKNIDLMSESK